MGSDTIKRVIKSCLTPLCRPQRFSGAGFRQGGGSSSRLIHMGDRHEIMGSDTIKKMK